MLRTKTLLINLVRIIRKNTGGKVDNIMLHSIISKLIKNLQASLKDLEDLKDEASSVGIGSSSVASDRLA